MTEVMFRFGRRPAASALAQSAIFTLWTCGMMESGSPPMQLPVQWSSCAETAPAIRANSAATFMVVKGVGVLGFEE
jgi:hypothetical protein